MRRVRYWFKHRLSWALVTIKGGPLKGYWFGLFTGKRFIKGTYNEKEMALIAAHAGAGDVVFDIGAHVGYFTLLASHVVGDQGKVFAFEPLPLNLQYLHRHVRANRLSNVEIVPAAVGAADDWLSFNAGGGTGRGRLVVGKEGNRVRVLKLDTLYRDGCLPPPALIKMDIEGAEGDALEGAGEMLTESRPVILLSTHGKNVKAKCESFLTRLGYRLSHISKSNLLAIPPEE